MNNRKENSQAKENSQGKETLYTIKFKIKEVFELVQLLKIAIQNNNDKDLKSAYRKLNNIKLPMENYDYNYDLPIWKPKNK